MDLLDDLEHQHPELKRNVPKTAFAGLTVNFGPQSFTPPHLDPGNAVGWCTSTALGLFDPDKGGEMVFWNQGIRLIIRFPLGSSMLFPSGLVVHSNIPIRPQERRYSLIQYTAGALFRWRYNGYQSDKSWFSKATSEQKALREEERSGRGRRALDSFTKWKDVLVGNWRRLKETDSDSESRVYEPDCGERLAKRMRV